MTVSIYLDRFAAHGFLTEDEVLYAINYWGSAVDVENVPRELLIDYYSEFFDNAMTFDEWWSKESITEDFDDLLGYHGWLPFLVDIPLWMQMKEEIKRR